MSGAARAPEDAAPASLDAVVSHHRDPNRSGVSRFNEILAERLGVPVLALADAALDGTTHPLLSFKVSELSGVEAARLERLLDAGARPSLFLHELGIAPLERRLVESAREVFCGDAEIEARVSTLGASARTAWAPGLILDQRRFAGAETRVFSFGMAHKIRTDMFARLRELLEASGRSYRLYVSSANHETATLADAQLVFAEMAREFGEGLYFMGNLSDVAVYNELLEADVFAAFFDRGVRANNTSVASAMECGAVVLTNLDEHSPEWLEHGRNVLDIERLERLPSDPLELRRIGTRAMETARQHSWERLVTEMGRTTAAR